MSKIKNEFFEQINENNAPKSYPEPYIYKYTVYFYYNGEARTIMADTFEDIEDIAKTIVPGFYSLFENYRETGYHFDCGDWMLPVKLYENQNVIYK
jgi:hypothetical protein